MQPHPIETPSDPASPSRLPRPTRGRRIPSWRRLGHVALAAVLVTATAGGLAQGDTDPAHVVVAQLGDDTLTRDAFDRRFEAAVRSSLAQQGVEPDAATLADFEAQRPAFLELLGEELVLSAHAARLGLAVSDADVAAVVEDAEAQHGDQLEAFLGEIGFGSRAEFTSAVHRSLSAQRAIEVLRAEVTVDDAAIEAWYEANPDQVQGPDGPLALETVREPIADLLANAYVEERVTELVAASALELHPERL